VFAIIGLGNPGSEYEGTRHNIGFAVVDGLAKKLNVNLRSGRGEYAIGLTAIGEQKLALVKPLTYMNNSGIAVREIIEWYKVSIQDLIIITDDFHLPLGTLRLRLKGSDGGHNGLYSIINHLQSDEFPRMRCGIESISMPKNKKEMANFVLSPFDKIESDTVHGMIDRAQTAAIAAATDGVETAMNRFNTTRA
jgi:PTH1 family peptidyl-tRNA hydrolase